MEKERTLYRFIPISKEIIKNNSSYPFNIYKKNEEKQFSILLKKNEPFTKSLECFLLDEKHPKLYIIQNDKQLYKEYLQHHITRLLDDDKITIDIKSSLMKELASETVNDLFQSEMTPQSLKNVDMVLDNYIKVILNEQNAMYSMLKVTTYDYYTYTHCIDVATYAIGFGSYLQLSVNDLSLLGKAAMLHDIGKKLVPHEIINKKGFLTNDEFNIMKKHPEYGVQILKENGEKNPKLLSLVLQHHEKCDGSGYPQGLKEHQINRLAKIISICDVFNALTTKRAYKERMTSFEAFRIMCLDMKNHLDKQELKEFINFMGCTIKDFEN